MGVLKRSLLYVLNSNCCSPKYWNVADADYEVVVDEGIADAAEHLMVLWYDLPDCY